MELLIGRDDQVKAVSIRIHCNGGRLTILRRPIQRVCPLEVKDFISGSHPFQPMNLVEVTVDREPEVVPE